MTDLIPVRAAVTAFIKEREVSWCVDIRPSIYIGAGSDFTLVKHFVISTWDRHLWLDIRAALADLVQSQGCVIREDRSWSGEHEHLYEFLVMPGNSSRHPWKPMTVCRSDDLRADRALFNYLGSRGVRPLDASYGWTETGVDFIIYDKHDAKQVQKVFSDCETTLVRNPDERGAWSLLIVFPS